MPANTARHFRLSALLGATCLVAACAAPTTAPTAGGSPGPSLAPHQVPTPTPVPRRFQTGFEGEPVGASPADWVDVKGEASTPDWVYAGNWKVAADESGNKVFLHDDLRSATGVSFRRYKGGALGKPDGALPDRYYAEVTVRPIKAEGYYAPTGDQGQLFYFLDPRRYVEVVLKPDMIEIWEADGGEPKTSKGWRRLWHQPLVTRAGDKRRVGALVDAADGSFTAYLDGKPLGSARSPLIKPQPAYFTLRGIGNVVSFDDVLIEAR